MHPVRGFHRVHIGREIESAGCVIEEENKGNVAEAEKGRDHPWRVRVGSMVGRTQEKGKHEVYRCELAYGGSKAQMKRQRDNDQENMTSS